MGSCPVSRFGNRQGIHEEGNGRERLVFHVRQVAPVVPPHERAVQDGQNVGVLNRKQEDLGVAESSLCIKCERGMELNLLIDDLGLVELLPIGARSEFPPKSAFVQASHKRVAEALEMVVN